MSNIYQINVRTWKHTNSHSNSVVDTPPAYWRSLKERGIDYVWLMGVWETSPSSIDKYCFHPDLIREYDFARPAWQRGEVGGSPYAIEDYQPSGWIGSIDRLIEIKSIINQAGMGLILDFIPNHFNAESKLLQEKPELFFSQAAEKSVPDGFFRTSQRHFAHGRDPYFDPWTDTAQLNYFQQSTHRHMKDVLLRLSEWCDGVRCDMAMLILPDIFERTWGHLRKNDDPTPNFWQVTIPAVKAKRNDFVFIAEAYWDTEWRLQEDGFDLTYDKKLLDQMLKGEVSAIKGHLSGKPSYHQKMVHFIENHDEQRSLTSFGFEKAMAAASIVATLPGSTLYFDGQWRGARKRLPVQLAAPAEEYQCPCPIGSTRLPCGCICISSFYDRLLEAAKHKAVRKGTWHLITASSLNDILAWIWKSGDQHLLVMVNLTSQELSGSIELGEFAAHAIPHDILNGIESPDYFFPTKDDQWQITLPAYRCAMVTWS